MGHTEVNAQVLNLVQAMIGYVTPNFRMVTVEVAESGAVTLTFLLENDSEEDREEISDIVFEFEALQEQGHDVDVNVVVDDQALHLIVPPGRCVYGRKEPGIEDPDPGS